MSDKTEKATRKPALGKGLNSLLGLGGDHPDHKVVPSSKTNIDMTSVINLNLGQLEANPFQPRKNFDDAAIQSLAASIKHDGVLQPIVVTKAKKPGRYTIVAGERRWRASQLAGKENIPVIVKDANPPDLLRLALIENIQRSDLNPMEEAEAYSALLEEFGLSQEQCSLQVGKDRATISNFLRLLTLPKSIQVDVGSRVLTVGHAKALLAIRDPKQMKYARDLVVSRNLSVRQTEQLCKRIRDKSSEDHDSEKEQRVDADMAYLVEALRSKLKTKVRLVGTGSRGKLEISYFSPSEFERIIELVGITD